MTTPTTRTGNIDAPLKALIDLNIILDTPQRREPYCTDSGRVLACAELGAATGFMAAHSWANLFYVYAEDQSADQARVHLTELLQFLSVAPIDQFVVEQALNLPYQDFEDAVQMMAAMRSGADYLLTGNIEDYMAGSLPVLQPAEPLALLSP